MRFVKSLQLIEYAKVLEILFLSARRLQLFGRSPEGLRESFLSRRGVEKHGILFLETLK